jgi:hypothetical protein
MGAWLPAENNGMAEHRADWRPPTDTDWRRLRTLLRDLMIHLQHDAENWERAEQDLRAIGAEQWATDIGRYADRATRARELATWVEDEYRALEGSHRRKVRLDARGMFPGTSAP